MGGPARPDFAQPDNAPQQSFNARSAQVPVTTDRLPAYPGGPIPGEEIPETIDGDL
jgi:hypothetical protein